MDRGDAGGLSQRFLDPPRYKRLQSWGGEPVGPSLQLYLVEVLRQ